MKIFLVLKSFLALVFISSTSVVAATNELTNPKSPQVGDTRNSHTNMSFDELLIQGQYHFSDEAVITVESDKVLDALLGVRKDFKDRIQQSSTR